MENIQGDMYRDVWYHYVTSGLQHPRSATGSTSSKCFTDGAAFNTFYDYSFF